MMQMPPPDASILARRQAITQALRQALPDAVIDDPAETRAYECDALSAYRCAPLAVVLPRSTEEVSRLLRLCHDLRVPVVPRGAGTSLAGGSMPTADAVVIGLSRMTDVLEIAPGDRLIRVQAGRTNLSVSGAVDGLGFFYAPDPSSQLACAIGGNIAMNSGGAHCLKYGVTTNNLLGVTVVLMDGSVVHLGGPMGEGPGLDLLGVDSGSEGQLGIVTEATLRILPKPAGARPALIGFAAAETAGACVAAIIRAGIIPVAIEFMDAPCIKATEEFSGAGYPDCEALLIVEVEGTGPEIDEQLTADPRHRHDLRPGRVPRKPVRRRIRPHLEGPEIGLWRDGQHGRLYLPGRHDPGDGPAHGPGGHRRSVAAIRAGRVERVSRRRRQHAPPDHL